MEQIIQVVVLGFLLAFIRIAVGMQRSEAMASANALYTGINSRCLHGCSFIDTSSRWRSCQRKGVGTSHILFLGLARERNIFEKVVFS